MRIRGATSARDSVRRNRLRADGVSFDRLLQTPGAAGVRGTHHHGRSETHGGRHPAPARVSSFLPEPKPAIKAPTYSVVVNEVPVKELLLALARDTKQNIDIHPGLQGLVSLNAINETLPGILERVSKQVPCVIARQAIRWR